MLKKVVISDKGKPFLLAGQLWMYRSNLVSADKEIEDGDIVRIVSEDGEFIASGFYSAASHIAVRIISHDEDEKYDEGFFALRIAAALAYRDEVMGQQSDNCRIIYGEADGLPGWTVDRYNDILVSQISCSGVEKRKDVLFGLLLEAFNHDGKTIKAIYERNDLKAREKEGLPLYKGFFYGSDDEGKTVIRENGIMLEVDYINGQKTGYFLDQKFNRLYLQKIAKGHRVLDCFCHTGGFSLNAARGKADRVTGVDVSQTALDQGRRNAELNALEEQINFVQDDVFEYLKKGVRGEYDLIILDPPAFTKNRRTADHAYNGYLQINRDAMNLLEDGGCLISCSCSRFMERDDFEKMLREAAEKENVSFTVIDSFGQSPDHPVLRNNGETDYLKFFVLKIRREKEND